MKRVGVVGGRGYVGAELLKLIDGHPQLALSFACSRSKQGQVISRVVPKCNSQLSFENLTPDEIKARDVDVVVLALPNDLAKSYVEVLATSTAVILDLSSDYRFDDQWYYGLPELTREHAAGKRLISNPGCYATTMQLALYPIADSLNGAPTCFGVSGYSGAGSIPSDKNDPQILRDNVVSYRSINHIHEREVTRQLKHAVHFLPNVASFFRGISMSVNANLKSAITQSELNDVYAQQYQEEPLIELTDAAPHVNTMVNHMGAKIGGLVVDDSGTRVVVHCVLDNLLKGAASQALQNINLACDLNEFAGIL